MNSVTDSKSGEEPPQRGKRSKNPARKACIYRYLPRGPRQVENNDVRPNYKSTTKGKHATTEGTSLQHMKLAIQRNLYVAYYARKPTPTNPGRYHTALIVLPHPLKLSVSARDIICLLRYALSNMSLPPKSENQTATKYHVVNVPVADETGKGRVSWEFRVEKDDAAAKGTSLRLRLIALMLVGVIEPSGSLGEEQTVEEVVRNVDVPKYADERPEWRCTTWVFEALKLLCDAKRIPSLPPLLIPEFWQIGSQFSDKWKTAESVEKLASGASVPCCDKEGNEITSPLGVAV